MQVKLAATEMVPTDQFYSGVMAKAMSMVTAVATALARETAIGLDHIWPYMGHIWP